ncbi:MAG: PDZ domain-containing protein, partial [Bacilli bacterium]|nr:PDZ domain-containing protein [Bacilli bacterium]
MRKILWTFLCFIIPFWVFAYSEYIIPGGDTLGIEVNSNGVVIVGFYKVNGELINQDFKIGDKILKVNKEEVVGTKELVDLIDQYMEDGKVSVTYSRNNKEYETDLSLSLYNGTYRTGLYVKGNVLGIGTLSYIDPETGVYGILGHSLNISSTNQQVEIRDGYSYEASVTSFTRSVDGNPGSKNADIDKKEVFGTIEKNSNYGVFGKVEGELSKKLMKVGNLDEVKTG